MATVRLTDVIVPEVYASYQVVDSPEKTAFFESGIVVSNALLNAKANTGGDTENIPFWNDLDSNVAPNLSDDNPANLAVPNKITTGKQVARLAYLNQWYSTADLAGEVAGSDPMMRIRNRFGRYWKRQWQKRLIATSNGVLADNVANDSGDMVVDVASESIAGQSATTLFNRNSFTNAVYTMGDMAEELTAIGVHSAVMSQMVKNDDIDYIPDSAGRLTIPTYMGLRVIVDDGFTVTAGSTDGVKYTSVLFGRGAFGYGEGSPTVPVEVERQGLQGNGGGVEYLGERKTWILHPFGFADTGTPAGQSYTLAELALAATWNRVVERKNVPMGFLITN
jgi:hypothetical protein